MVIPLLFLVILSKRSNIHSYTNISLLFYPPVVLGKGRSNKWKDEGSVLSTVAVEPRELGSGIQCCLQ